MSYVSQPVQLPLSVQIRDDATFENFFSGDNAALVNMLDMDQQVGGVDSEQFIYLYGAPGVGCSHLLQAACHQVDRRKGRSIYLPMKELVHYPSKLLEGMERLQLVCVDDVNAVAGIPEWEEGLFDLFNRLRDSRTRLLVAADCPPKRLAILLPDLVSRLSWGLVFQVQPLSDRDKVSALQLRAHLRGLDLNEDVARYIIYRSNRDMGHLFKMLQKLDSASLRAKRKLTIPFVKQVMNW
ncbi:DnaA regulatory inactivator Hda [Endozoicomonas sp. 8E]|uniref:DnaA regulatory inactivator Hda n=1 Tax=Endozoicomonas sp. 8E TaxID=3035692 RepID=UPI002938EDAE|nr:DnaA regulatory inactivator Hda [Endozoicomonas sp. 8E]WOG26137.1 DnaA regulatory inactivator Hda [Endozoicomonas sp. 8E]